VQHGRNTDLRGLFYCSKFVDRLLKLAPPAPDLLRLIANSGPHPGRGPPFEKVSLRDRFRAFDVLLRVINVAVYAACFRRLAIFAIVARLQPVNDWIVLQDCCAASI